MAPVGLHQGVQHGADPDGIVGHAALGGGGSTSHGARAPFVVPSGPWAGSLLTAPPPAGGGRRPVRPRPSCLPSSSRSGEGCRPPPPGRAPCSRPGRRRPSPAGRPAAGRSAERPAARRDHEGHADLAEDGVGSAHHRHLVDGRVRPEHRLDLGRIDVVAAPDVELVGPTDQVEAAVARRRSRSRRWSASRPRPAPAGWPRRRRPAPPPPVRPAGRPSSRASPRPSAAGPDRPHRRPPALPPSSTMDSSTPGTGRPTEVATTSSGSPGTVPVPSEASVEV